MSKSLIKIFCLLIFCATTTVRSEAQTLVRVPEGVVRKVAKTVVMPAYPATSKKRRTQGLAVVTVDIDERGDVTNVAIVEAPDEDIGKSVMTAVRQWKFSELTAEGKPVRLQGKLSFYFRINGGKARVSNPEKFEAAWRKSEPSAVADGSMSCL
jgi:TonB family protein